jgi:hypothetical protein
MPSRIQLSTGNTVDVEAEPTEVHRALNSGSGRLRLIELRARGKDTNVLINPEHVALVEPAPSRRASPSTA